MSSCSPQPNNCAPGNGALPPLSPEEIDASCRVPVMALLYCAAGWLVLSSIFALFASLVFHVPRMFQHCAWLTYGHLQAANLNLMVYGFAIPAGLGVLLWLVARLGRTTLVFPEGVTLGALLWNFGVLAGLLAILSGNNSGFEWLEMPASVNGVFFAAYAVIGLAAVLTYHGRREPQLYVSQWFLLSAVFWFPWIFATATALLQCLPARGTMQAVVHFWYANNLNVIWFGFVGLAAIFYFLPKLTGRPLYSAKTAMTTFWVLAVCGCWGGIPHGTPVPAWMPSLSTVATVLTVVAVLAVVVNYHKTLQGAQSRLKVDVSLRFIQVSVISYVLAGLAQAISSVRAVAEVTYFTHFTTALTRLGLFGFFAMAIFGAVYYIVPRLTGLELSEGLAKAHFWLAVAGLIFFVVPLGLGGVLQGMKLNNIDAIRHNLDEVSFANITAAALKLFRISTMGDLFILVGNLLFLLNLKFLAYRWCRARCCGGCCPGCSEGKASQEVAA